MSNEKVVQDAIHAALVAHFNQPGMKGLTLHAPSNRSQGADLGSFCADLIGVLDSARVLLLEVKMLTPGGKLAKFNLEQHQHLLDYEEVGVPVAYAYNVPRPDSLAYWITPRMANWAEETLRQINRSPAWFLASEIPNRDAHQSLWDWLMTSSDERAHEMFGAVVGAWQSPTQLRNGKLVLIYSASAGTMALLSPDEVNEIRGYLQSKRHLTPLQEQRALKILKASDEAVGRLSTLHGWAPTTRTTFKP